MLPEQTNAWRCWTGLSHRKIRKPHEPEAPTAPRLLVLYDVAGNGGWAHGGIVVQVNETAPLYKKTVAMNEALILGSLRQHEIAAVASSNVQLQTAIGEGKQREREAQTLTNEISHQIKNNLQIVSALIGHEANSRQRRASKAMRPCRRASKPSPTFTTSYLKPATAKP